MDTSFFEQRVGEELDFLSRGRSYKFIDCKIEVDIYRRYWLRIITNNELGYDYPFPKNFDFSEIAEASKIAKKIIEEFDAHLEGEDA